MMSDEDSRDSGISDMDYASMPTSFSIIGDTDFGSFNTVPMEIDEQELDEMENTMCEELMQITDESQEPAYRIRKELANITTTFSNLSNKDCDIRRFQSCSTTEFDESPKSRTLFVRPSALSVRNPNVDVNTTTTKTTSSKFHIVRKRTFGGFELPVKRVRRIHDENEDSPSTSQWPEPVPSVNNKVPKLNASSSSFHRTASSSVLERGESYAKHHNGKYPHVVEARYNLKTVSPSCSNAFRRITAATLHELLSNMSDEEFRRKFLLVDCRYPYEFDGGHIKHAVNIFDPAECERIFYNSDGTKKDDRVPIFYCEYSQKRGPSMAHCLRRLDRQINELKYPHVDYQEMYVLDKGFRNFYSFTKEEQISAMCQPDNYITMDDSRFTCELKKWSFHKKAVVGTSVRVVESRSRLMLRQLSADSHFSSETPAATGRVTSRRPLFIDKSPSSFGLSTVPEMRTPSPPFEKLVQPHFS